MLKKLAIIALVALSSACVSTKDEGKTPQTLSGKFNSCMLNSIYDLKDSGKLFYRDKWSTAHDIMKSCERKLHISSSEINEKQSINIIVSVIDSLRK